MLIYAVFVLTVSIIVGTTAGFVTYHLLSAFFLENLSNKKKSDCPIKQHEQEF
jgi:xanthine/uracil/vitamin C permease (AzgA family)